MERITSRKNPKIQYWKKLSGSAAFRRQNGEMICDGAKLLEEAVRWGVTVTALAASEGTDAAELPDVPRYLLPEDLMAYVSPMKTPQGIMFTCRIPENGMPAEGTRFVVLEGVQDPGNVGAVLRTARAMGYNGVYLLPGCADPYGPRAVRASMGAAFQLPVMEADYGDLDELKRRGVEIYAAALGEDSMDVRQAEYARSAVCIGSEGSGLSERLLRICTGRIRIPMESACESLNAAVAAGIIMWESVRGQKWRR